jgi:putative transposase
MATIRQSIATYALTISTFQQHRHFQVPANTELFIATIFRYRDQQKYQLHGFVVMPDHAHILLSPASDQSTSRCVQFIKGGYSFAVRHQSKGEIWHSGYHEHRIRDREDYENQLRYIANNPIRRHLDSYPYVHTQFSERLDPPPAIQPGPTGSL